LRNFSFSQINHYVNGFYFGSYKDFGVGEITHIFGSGNKISLAIKFPSLGQKIIDPKIAQLQQVD